jgi:hypothetical protein
MARSGWYEWNTSGITPKSFICGYCDTDVSSEKGFAGNYIHQDEVGHKRSQPVYIYICHRCKCPNFFDNKNIQTPGSRPELKKINNLPEDVGELYDQAIRSFSVNAFTPAVMCCRVILMHIAVEKDAKEGESFQFYVDHLANLGYVPPNGKKWVDKIRKKGNKANHKIEIMTKDDADEILRFLNMLMIFIYELGDDSSD